MRLLRSASPTTLIVPGPTNATPAAAWAWSPIAAVVCSWERGRARHLPASGSTRPLSPSGPSSRSMFCSIRSRNIPPTAKRTSLCWSALTGRTGQESTSWLGAMTWNCAGRVQVPHFTPDPHSDDTSMPRATSARPPYVHGCRARDLLYGKLGSQDSSPFPPCDDIDAEPMIDDRLRRGVDASWTSDGRGGGRRWVSRASTTWDGGIDFSYRFGAAA